MRPTRASIALAALIPTAAVAGYDPCPSTDWGVSTIALEAEQAFVAGEPLDLRSAVADVRTAVECLDEAISPETAAAVHRAHALDATWSGDERAAASAWRAAMLAEPSWEPPRELAPPGGALALEIEQARGEPDPSRAPLKTARGMALRLDGSPSWRRATSLPVVLQLIDAEGHPVRTAYLPPGAPLPAGILTDTGQEPPRAARPSAPTMRVSSRTGQARVVLIGGAGALAAGALGLGIGSAMLRSEVSASEEHCADRVEGCSPVTERAIAEDQRLARGLGIGAGVAAAGSLALGVGVVVAW